MKRNLLALLFAGGALAATPALAHNDVPGTGEAPGQADRSRVSGQNNPSIGLGAPSLSQAPNVLGKADEPKKHLAEIDIYVKDAINNVKVVYETTQLQPGRMDMTMQREGLANVDQSIQSALTHVQHIKTLPEAQVADKGKLSQLEHDLTDARQLLVKLRGAVKSDAKSQLQTYSSRLYGTLKQADDNLAQLAQEVNLPRVDQLQVPEKQPVAGHRSSSLERQEVPGRGLGPQNDPSPLPGIQDPTNVKGRSDDGAPNNGRIEQSDRPGGLLDRDTDRGARVPDRALDLPQHQRGLPLE